MEIPKYITSITKEQLRMIFEVANITIDPGIKIKREFGAVRIGVDELQLKQWMRAFHDNGGFTCSHNDVNGIPLNYSN